MATDPVLESSSVPHGRLKVRCERCVNTHTIKSVCIRSVVAHTVLLAVGIPTEPMNHTAVIGSMNHSPVIQSM